VRQLKTTIVMSVYAITGDDERTNWVQI
jgi:hypothetical protein